MKYFSVILLLISIFPIVLIPIGHYEIINIKFLSMFFNTETILIKEQAVNIFFQYMNLYTIFILGIYLGINFNSDNAKTFITDIFSIVIFIMFFITLKNENYQKIMMIFTFFITQIIEMLFLYLNILPKSIFIIRVISNIIIMISAILININLNFV